MREVLVIRHHKYKRRFYDVVLRWVEMNAPQVLSSFDVIDVDETRNWRVNLSKTRILVPWLQDPVQDWSPTLFSRMLEFQNECDARDIRVFNRVEHLTNASKSVAPRLVSLAGLKMARTVEIADRDEFIRDFGGLRFPILVRDDWGHDKGLVRVDSPDLVHEIDLSKFARPVATEIIDARSPSDGLFRKFRYFACADIGISHHLQVSGNWVTRGGDRIFTDDTRAEELTYIAEPDPHHTRFQAARRALKLDLVAFDYGYGPDGKVIVWEANPFPYVKFGQTTSAYRNLAIHRTIAAMTAMYLSAARLEVPVFVKKLVSYHSGRRAGLKSS